MSDEEYHRLIREQEHQHRWNQFILSYPPHIWAQMTELQRAEAWAQYQQQERPIAATRSRWTFWRIVGAIIVAIIVLSVIAFVL